LFFPVYREDEQGRRKDEKEEFKLKGFSYPLTLWAVSSIVGPYPWHYGTEYLNILYRTDPEVIASYLPYPLEPERRTDLAYVAFSRWWSLWEEDSDMPWLNPERTQYLEAANMDRLQLRGEAGTDMPSYMGRQRFQHGQGLVHGIPEEAGAGLHDRLSPPEPRNGTTWTWDTAQGDSIGSRREADRGERWR
jgi:hypothetical protein